jgi:hypothetical protein
MRSIAHLIAEGYGLSSKYLGIHIDDFGFSVTILGQCVLGCFVNSFSLLWLADNSLTCCMS